MQKNKIKSKPASRPRVTKTLRLDLDIIALANDLAEKLKKSEAEVFEMGIEALDRRLRK